MTDRWADSERAQTSLHNSPPRLCIQSQVCVAVGPRDLSRDKWVLDYWFNSFWCRCVPDTGCGWTPALRCLGALTSVPWRLFTEKMAMTISSRSVCFQQKLRNSLVRDCTMKNMSFKTRPSFQEDIHIYMCYYKFHQRLHLLSERWGGGVPYCKYLLHSL